MKINYQFILGSLVGSSLVGGALFAHSPKIRQVAFLFACQFPRKEDVTLRFASSAPGGV